MHRRSRAWAGIGGLTAALALRESGFDAHVYEQARVLREVGAGLALGANAVRVLHRQRRLLAPDVRAVAALTAVSFLRSARLAALVVHRLSSVGLKVPERPVASTLTAVMTKAREA